MSKRLLGGLLAVSCVILSPSAMAADPTAAFMTPAPRLDTGLGELPPYSGAVEVWMYSQPAAKQDSGLGELPNAAESREVWMFIQPAPKVDNGLGDETRPARMAARSSQDI